MVSSRAQSLLRVRDAYVEALAGAGDAEREWSEAAFWAAKLEARRLGLKDMTDEEWEVVFQGSTEPTPQELLWLASAEPETFALPDAPAEIVLGCKRKRLAVQAPGSGRWMLTLSGLGFWEAVRP